MSSLDCGRSVKVGKRNVLVERLLGSGAFGVVFRVKDTSDGRVFALKDVECKSDSQIEKVVREVNALIAAKHQHILEIMGVDTYKPAQNTHFLILTEFCSGGDLNKRLDRGSSHELNMKWVHQLADAVNYLHSHQPPIVHRDLKADNVFLTNPLAEDIKLGDLGLAREFVATQDEETLESYYMTSGVGPTHWMAPEFFIQHYNEKADIFSLGVLYYGIFARHFERFGATKMYGVFVKIPEVQFKVGLGFAMYMMKRELVVPFGASFQASSGMKRLVQDMLRFQPDERPRSDEVLERVGSVRSSIRLDSARGPARVTVSTISVRPGHIQSTRVSRTCNS